MVLLRARFFADCLAAFFESLIPLSDSLLAGNPATAGAIGDTNAKPSQVARLEMPRTRTEPSYSHDKGIIIELVYRLHSSSFIESQ